MMAFKEDSQLNTDRVRSSGSSGGSGGAGLKIGGGLGGVILVLAVSIIFGQDGLSVLNQVTGGSGFNYQQVEGNAEERFAHCKTGEDANAYTDCNMIATGNSLDYFWQKNLPDQAGTAYAAPSLDLFVNQTVSTGCGSASQDVGPFYCPADQVAYVQTGFFDTMKTQLGATGGQSAEQYVLAHEYGHHIQNLLGDLKYSQYDPQGADSGAVRVELQADCYAGVWAKGAQQDASSAVQIKPFSSDELERIINATEVIGDDHIQMTSQGHTDSSTYTHGTSSQRTAWFMTGYNSGDMTRCNTFKASDLNTPGS